MPIFERRQDSAALAEIPMRHNRRVFNRSNHYHSINDLFGSGIEGGRLVQLSSSKPPIAP